MLSCVAMNDGSEFDGSVRQKVKDERETPISLAWAASTSNIVFGVATKYHLDSTGSFGKCDGTQCSFLLGSHHFCLPVGVRVAVAVSSSEELGQV
ncbi:voltage-dependent anion-selective channel protein 2-like [Arapaima gigas]